jgi:hypothetical protein
MHVICWAVLGTRVRYSLTTECAVAGAGVGESVAATNCGSHKRLCAAASTLNSDNDRRLATGRGGPESLESNEVADTMYNATIGVVSLREVAGAYMYSSHDPIVLLHDTHVQVCRSLTDPG